MGEAGNWRRASTTSSLYRRRVSSGCCALMLSDCCSTSRHWDLSWIHDGWVITGRCHQKKKVFIFIFCVCFQTRRPCMAGSAGPCLRDGDQREAAVAVDTALFAFTSWKFASLHPDRSEQRASEWEFKGFVRFKGHSLPHCPSVLNIRSLGACVFSFPLIYLANLDGINVCCWRQTIENWIISNDENEAQLFTEINQSVIKSFHVGFQLAEILHFHSFNVGDIVIRVELLVLTRFMHVASPSGSIKVVKSQWSVPFCLWRPSRSRPKLVISMVSLMWVTRLHRTVTEHFL